MNLTIFTGDTPVRLTPELWQLVTNEIETNVNSDTANLILWSDTVNISTWGQIQTELRRLNDVFPITPNCILAGYAIFMALLQGSSGIADVYMVNVNAYRANQILGSISSESKSDVRTGEYVEVERDYMIYTVHTQLYQNIRQIIDRTDIDAGALAYDGTDIWITERCMLALVVRVNLYRPQHSLPGYTLRLMEYSRKGISIEAEDFNRKFWNAHREPWRTDYVGIPALMHVEDIEQRQTEHDVSKSVDYFYDQLYDYHHPSAKSRTEFTPIDRLLSSVKDADLILYMKWLKYVQKLYSVIEYQAFNNDPRYIIVESLINSKQLTETYTKISGFLQSLIQVNSQFSKEIDAELETLQLALLYVRNPDFDFDGNRASIVNRIKNSPLLTMVSLSYRSQQVFAVRVKSSKTEISMLLYMIVRYAGLKRFNLDNIWNDITPGVEWTRVNF
jgi:hypothetical protein